MNKYIYDFKQKLILIGKRIKELRAQQNMTLKDLSNKSGISVNYLKKIESGKAFGINTTHLYRLYKSFELKSIKDLLNFY